MTDRMGNGMAKFIESEVRGTIGTFESWSFQSVRLWIIIIIIIVVVAPLARLLCFW